MHSPRPAANSVCRTQPKTPLTTSAAFSLLELLVVLVLIGILAITVLPYFADESSFEQRQARDEFLTHLRYAQQLAMADNSRTIRFTTTSTSYRIDDNGMPLQVPDNDGIYPRQLPSNITLSPVTTLSFSALGDTSATTFNLSGGYSVCVSAAGYAYAC